MTRKRSRLFCGQCCSAVPQKEPQNPLVTSCRFRLLTPRPRLGCLCCLSQRQRGLADLFGNDGKTCQTCSSKARGNSNICGVTAACHYDPADPRMVVTRVEREPS